MQDNINQPFEGHRSDEWLRENAGESKQEQFQHNKQVFASRRFHFTNESDGVWGTLDKQNHL